MKRTILGITAVAIIGFVACQKEKQNTNPASGGTNGLHLSLKTMPQVTLDQNGVGEWHNYYLDLVYSQLSNDIGSIGYNNYTVSDANTSLRAVLYPAIKGNDSTLYRNTAISIGNSYLNSYGVASDLAANRANIANSTSISTGLKNALSAFWAKCDTVTCLAGATSIGTSFKTYCSSHFQGTEQLIGIGTADVFMDSYAYWDANLVNWCALLTNSQTTDNTYQAKASIAASDAAGFTTGSIIGATGGTVTIPGVGTFAGWAGGGLAGGFYGSATAAIAKFWDWLFG